MASPTKSLTKYLQSVGRIARLKTKDYVERFGQQAIVMDIVDVTSRHALVNAWELDRDKSVEDRVFVSKEKKEKLLEARRAKITHTREKDEIVKLISIKNKPKSNSIRMVEAATEKQLEFIKDLGYDIEKEVYTKKMVSEILDALPAKKDDVKKLKEIGFDVSRPINRGEASYNLWLYEQKGRKAWQKTRQ